MKLNARLLGLGLPSLLGALIGCGAKSDEPASETALTFCDAEAVLVAKCQRCHGETQQNGAPFPLVTYEDTQVDAPTFTDAERKRYDQMQYVIEIDFMPYMALTLDPPVQPLTCEEKTTLLEWLETGSPPPPEDDPDCSMTEPVLRSCR